MYKSIAVALSLALLSTTVYAKQNSGNGNGKGKAKKEKHQKRYKKSNKKASKGFSRAEKYTVQNYYRNLPRGLAKKYNRTGTLPRGWQNKVNVGERFPESYRVNLQPIPRELRETFEVGPIGSEVMRMGNKIIRLEQATNIILDVFEI
ncbi:MAG: hypothetical protein ABFQ64_08350 [Campylobacterota bacterium]